MTASGRCNLLLASQDPRTREALAPHLELMAFDQGHVFFRDGDHVNHLWFVERGIVSLVTELEDGFAVENTAIGHEGIVGLTSDLHPAQAFGIAIGLIAGEASRIELPRLREIARQDDRLYHKLSLFHEQITAESRQSCACLARHEVHHRLARWLLRCHDRHGETVLPLTQEFIGHMLGVRRSTVSLVAQELELAGLIRHARGAVEILDRRGLEARSCECYAAMRRRALNLGLEPPQAPF